MPRGGPLCPSAEGVDAAKSGKTMALLSTIGFGVGLVGVATGIVLIATAPSDAPARAAAPSRRRGRPTAARAPQLRADVRVGAGAYLTVTRTFY